MVSCTGRMTLGTIPVLLVLCLKYIHTSSVQTLKPTSKITSTTLSQQPSNSTFHQPNTDSLSIEASSELYKAGNNPQRASSPFNVTVHESAVHGLSNVTYNDPKKTNSQSEVTSKDGDIESSGEFSVQTESGSGKEVGSGETNIKLSRQRLYSISEAITKLLNSGRKQLDKLKSGKPASTYRPGSPVLRAFVSDSPYDTPRLQHKRYRHRRYPRYYKRLDVFEESPVVFPYGHQQLEYSATKSFLYKRPYVYYPDEEDVRYETIPYQEADPYVQQQYVQKIEENILRNFALQQEIAGIQFYFCHPNPCKHGGRCRKDGLKFRCLCRKGFIGQRCQVRRRNRCNSNPCQNGGSCTEVRDGYECTCQDGFKGTKCQEHTKCTTISCYNGGTCTELDNGFECTCTVGFKGDTCRVPSPCSSDPCKNGGTCVEDDNSLFTCVCVVGWACHDCSCRRIVSKYQEGIQQKRSDKCHPNPCFNAGTCYATSTGFSCYCAPGYRGDICQVTRHCWSDPCLNEGTCAETSTGYRCTCQPQFRGKNCEKENHCMPVNPCENNGLCIEREDGYKCHCKIGYTGYNCEDREFCKPNPCKNGAICLPEEESYMCTCSIGYKGKNCESRDLCASNPCYHKGTCVDADNDSFKCLCPQEWMGTQCEVENPCYPNPCSHNGHCSVVDGRVHCRCSFGFKGDKCQEIDACRPNPCRHDGICIQRDQDNYDCDCKPGFLGDKCEGIDACSSYPCMFGGTCVRQEDGFKCVCDESRVGQLCEALNPCFPDPCHNNGICMRFQNGEPQCHCAVGFVGSVCDVVDPCKNNPCRNGGTCINVDRSFKCKCTPDYVGHLCDIKSKCQPNPCQNDGTCKDVATGRGFVCYCSVAYVGPNCNKPNLCHLNDPCKNGGTCKSDGTILGCQCKAGFLGSYCEQKNFCYGEPCHNGGTCTPKLSDYECDCRDGFYGKSCEAQNSACVPSPCKNNGLCTEYKNKDGYICLCKDGYLGKTCDKRDACSPNPCLHDGTCLQAKTHRGYHCLCHKGWYGYDCQRVDRCNPNPCFNGGSCYNNDDGHVCQCTERYQGQNCRDDKCDRCGINAQCIEGTCECKSGFVGNGFTCIASSDPCLPNPCDNNGACIPGHGGNPVFKCTCVPGFTGDKCQVSLSACITRPCLNGGICVDITNNNGSLLDGVFLVDSADFRCVCPKGYAGQSCDRLVLENPCINHPCEHGGTCYDDSNSVGMDLKLMNALDIRCFCQDGYSGKTCQAHQPACNSSPCLHGGTCIDAANTADVAFNYNGYKCLCPPGLLGSNCEVTKRTSPEALQAFKGSRVAALSSKMTAETAPKTHVMTGNAGSAITQMGLSPITIKVTADRPSSSSSLLISGKSNQQPAVINLPDVQPTNTENPYGGNTARENVPDLKSSAIRENLLELLKKIRHNTRYISSYPGYYTYKGQTPGMWPSARASTSPFSNAGGYTAYNTPYTRRQPWYSFYSTPTNQNTGYQPNLVAIPPFRTAYIHSKDDNNMLSSHHNQ